MNSSEVFNTLTLSQEKTVLPHQATSCLLSVDEHDKADEQRRQTDSQGESGPARSKFVKYTRVFLLSLKIQSPIKSAKPDTNDTNHNPRPWRHCVDTQHIKQIVCMVPIEVYKETSQDNHDLKPQVTQRKILKCLIAFCSSSKRPTINL
jgi:hypothetical protein